MSRLLWHRRDLRINDNELYSTGAQKIYSLFIFDPSDYSPRPTGITDDNGLQLLGITHGPHFTRRLLDAVHSLRRSLQSLGGDLIVREGDPLELIPKLAQELQVDEVAWSEIPGYYECDQSEKLKNGLLRDHGPYRCNVYTTCSLTLVDPINLPTDQCTWDRLARPKQKRKKRASKSNDADAVMAMETNNDNGFSSTITNISTSRFVGMAAIMGDFRRVAQTSAPIRDLFEGPNPRHIAQDFLDLDMMGDIPSLEELSQPLLDTTLLLLGCLPKELIQKLVQSAIEMPRNHGINAEKQSIQHLHHFVENHAASANRSLCDVSNNNSSKLSTRLALGTLSPQQVYHCVKRQVENDLFTADPADINWLINHMEMRDFFLFDSFRNGHSAYRLHPTKPVHKPDSPREWRPLSKNHDNFIRWASGLTNLPLVDAGMKELLQTGYTSNRVRQNMASVLTKDLKLDWRLGAEWMQLCLEDHCVAANFGNWIYFAGVGGDPKNRHFRTVSQALRYDSDGRYVRKWIDRLREDGDNDVEVVLRPWDFQKDWCVPIVPPETQVTWHDRERLESTGRISSGDANT
ncbi:hypothetical protein ACHAXR_004810 [Thalassiosira sp. AJA248-18]